MNLPKDKNVLVIGGGDTGNDCVGTSIRLGAKSVITVRDDAEAASGKSTQTIHGRSGRESSKQTMVRKKLSPYSDMIHVVYQTTVTEFIKDKNGNVCQAKLVKLKA